MIRTGFLSTIRDTIRVCYYNVGALMSRTGFLFQGVYRGYYKGYYKGTIM